MTATLTFDDVRRALRWAEGHHDAQGQTYGVSPRGTPQSYGTHLYAVMRTLERHGVSSPEILCAAALHDVVEDTPVTLDDVRAEFGDRVAALVGAVTSEPGRNRRERWERTRVKIAADPDAIRIKLADRIANVGSCWEQRDGRLFMYRKEHDSFRRDLFACDRSPDVLAMWAALDALLDWRTR